MAGGVQFVGASDVLGGDHGSLHALLPDGSLHWSFRHGGHILSTPSNRDGVVFVESEGRNLYAIDVETGEEVWRYSAGGHVRTRPSLSGNTVVITSQHGFVYALGADEGALKWSQEGDQPVPDLERLARRRRLPATDETAVYAAARADLAGLEWSLSAHGLASFAGRPVPRPRF